MREQPTGLPLATVVGEVHRIVAHVPSLHLTASGCTHLDCTDRSAASTDRSGTHDLAEHVDRHAFKEQGEPARVGHGLVVEIDGACAHGLH